MADTSVLQHFLVELGFKVEKSSLEAFQKGLKGGATEAVAFGNIWAKVAEEAVEAAHAIVDAVFKMTAQMEQLYFASRTLGESGENIKSVGDAYERMGLSADQAKASLQGVREFILKTGGDQGSGVGLLRSLGIAAGPGVSLEETHAGMQRYLHDLEKINPAMAEIRRAQFGFSLQEVMMDPDEFARLEKQSKRIQEEFGLNSEASQKAGHDFQDSWRNVKETMGAFSQMVISQFIPSLTSAMNSLSSALTGNWANAWKQWSVAGVQWLNLLNQPLYQTYILLARIADMMGAHGAGAAAQAYVDQQTAAINKAAAAANAPGGAAPAATPAVPAAAAPAPAAPRPAPRPPPAAPAAPPPPAGKGGKGVDWGVGQQLYQMLIGMGASPEGARGAVGVLGSESMGFHPGARPIDKHGKLLSSARGLAQWLKDRVEAYQKATGQTVGEDVQSQMALMRWELTKGPYAKVLQRLRGAGSVAQGADIWSQGFEGIHPGTAGVGGRDDYGIDQRAYKNYLLSQGGGAPGGQTVTLSQKTDINITGVTDPAGAARAIADAQYRVNSDVIRRLATHVA